MRAKMEMSQQTSPNSPSRLFPEQISKMHSRNYFIMNGSTNYSTPRMSETENEIYTHRLIREVMEASRAKSISHDINRIDKESALYRLPLNQQAWEYYIDSIPPKNELFFSACSATIKNINQSLIHDSHPDKIQAERKTRQRKRPVSAISKMNTHNKKVSVSGLVTYNFNSLLAKKSLGFNLVNHEEKMISEMKTHDKKLYCSKQRNNRILAKSSGQRFQKKQKDQKAIMSDFGGKTDAYLKRIIAEREENAIIFNQRTKKLNCVKDYMESEKVDYDMAVHAVNIIEGGHKKDVVLTPKTERKTESDERQLIGRRVPMQRRPVVIRQFHFIE